MRFAILCFSLSLFVNVACGPDQCSGEISVPSQTSPMFGADRETWNDAACTSDEEDLCQLQTPKGNSLILCSHTANAVLADGGAFMSLACHYYSDDSSCHDAEHHDLPDIPLPPPPG